MVEISQRKLTIYLPLKMEMELLTLAHKNKMENLIGGVRGKEKLPETMGAIVRQVLEDHLRKKREQ